MWEFQKSRAPIKTSNSRGLTMRTPTQGPPIHINRHLRTLVPKTIFGMKLRNLSR